VYLHERSPQLHVITMPTPIGRSLLPRLFITLVIALVAALPFSAGLPGDFVFDDIPSIVNNDAIKLQELNGESLVNVATAPQISGSLRALPTLTFALDFWRSGHLDPAAFKSTNILIHALTACALAWFFHALLLTAGVKAGRARWAAVALSLAWALHPLQVSSVLYVVQRMQTLGTLFLVLALLAYLQARRAHLAGRSGRTGLLAAVLMWVVAMGCKEDSVLFPVYALALELTVLGFGAADVALARRLRRGYLAASVAGIVVYALILVPNYWHWEAYPARDFSSIERLLTQARVLCMYLWQIIVPMPSHMPFYYDWLQPSRGLLQPWTTLPSMLVVLALVVLAWRLRARWPLFSLGLLLFFGAHLITSNVIGLELAFEHRNHFALIGAVLALGSLLARAAVALRMPTWAQVVICVGMLSVLCGGLVLRARDWATPYAFAVASAKLAPSSGRAWFGLCLFQLEAGGGAVAGNPKLDQAIDACGRGAQDAPYALNSFVTLMVLKTLRGDVTPEDWARFQQRLETVNMNWENRRAPLAFSHHARNGVALDKQQMLKAFATLSRRVPIAPFNSASLGYFIMNDLDEPDQAMPYFLVAVGSANPLDPFPWRLADELREKNRPDLAAEIMRHASATRDAGDTAVQAGD